jgi:HTH-type transcriptional regulator/antitoxin MqsA
MERCASCGHHEVFHKFMDIPHHFMGRKTIIPEVECFVCPECNETFFENAGWEKLDAAMIRFNDEVTAALGISPAYIRQVRQKLDLGQKEAGKLLGGGVNAFSRYETGKTPPPVPLVKLLRILDSHPELLPMIR